MEKEALVQAIQEHIKYSMTFQRDFFKYLLPILEAYTDPIHENLIEPRDVTAIICIAFEMSRADPSPEAERVRSSLRHELGFSKEEKILALEDMRWPKLPNPLTLIAMGLYAICERSHLRWEGRNSFSEDIMEAYGAPWNLLWLAYLRFYVRVWKEGLYEMISAKLEHSKNFEMQVGHTTISVIDSYATTLTFSWPKKPVQELDHQQQGVTFRFHEI